MKVQAIIPTAGSGTRFKSDQLKSLVEINDKPVIVHTLEIFEKNPSIASIILVVPQDFMGEFEKVLKQYHLEKVSKIVAGGVTRCESVTHALKVVDADTNIIIVHDGVRPLVSQRIVNESLALCEKEAAVIVAVPVKPTIKRVEDLRVVATLDRRNLWEVQTPQVFKKDILLEAYEQNTANVATDDAMLVEQIGVPVKILEGDYRNIKITTQEDFVVAEAFLSKGIEQ